MSIAEELIERGRREARSIAEELIQKGRDEGRQQGRREGTDVGALIGRVQAFQELLGLPISQVADLANKSVAELENLVNDLRRRLDNGRKR